MNILIVAACRKELAPFVSENKIEKGRNLLFGHEIMVEYTGIGIACSVLKIAEYSFLYKPDIIIQAGIVGAYENSGLIVGDTVFVKSEVMADLGVVYGGVIKKTFDECKRLENPHYYPGKNVNGNTVNLAGAPYLNNSEAAIESMEGYGLFLVGLHQKIKFAELRSISNYVLSDRESWNIDLAVNNLSQSLSSFLKRL